MSFLTVLATNNNIKKRVPIEKMCGYAALVTDGDIFNYFGMSINMSIFKGRHVRMSTFIDQFNRFAELYNCSNYEL